MNRAIIGIIVLLLLLGGIVYYWRKTIGVSVQQLIPRYSPLPIYSPLPSFSPQPSSLPNALPTATPGTVLPRSGVLPATGL